MFILSGLSVSLLGFLAGQFGVEGKSWIRVNQANYSSRLCVSRIKSERDKVYQVIQFIRPEAFQDE